MQTDIIIVVLLAAILLWLFFIDSKQASIILKLNKIIMTNAEILALLEEADAQTNEIAADIQSLIDSGGVSAEVADKLTAHVEKLKGVAATHTP